MGMKINRLSQARRTLGKVFHSTRLLGGLELAWSQVLVMEALEGMTGAGGSGGVCLDLQIPARPLGPVPYSTKYGCPVAFSSEPSSHCGDDSSYLSLGPQANAIGKY